MAETRLEGPSNLGWLLKDSLRGSWLLLGAGILFPVLCCGLVFVDDAPYGGAGMILNADIVILSILWSGRQASRQSLCSSLPISTATTERLNWIEHFVLLPASLLTVSLALLAIRVLLYGLDWPFFYMTGFLLLTSLGTLAILWLLSDGPIGLARGFRANAFVTILLVGLLFNGISVTRQPYSLPLTHPILNVYFALPVGVVSVLLITASFFRVNRRRFPSRGIEERSFCLPIPSIRIPDWPLLRRLSVRDLQGVSAYCGAVWFTFVMVILMGKKEAGDVMRLGYWIDYSAVFIIPVILGFPDMHELRFSRLLPVSSTRIAALNIALRGALALLGCLPVVVLAQWLVPERATISYATPFLAGLVFCFLGLGVLTLFADYHAIISMSFGGAVGFAAFTFAIRHLASLRMDTPLNLEVIPWVLQTLLPLALLAAVVGFLLTRRGIEKLAPVHRSVGVVERSLGVRPSLLPE